MLSLREGYWAVNLRETVLKTLRYCWSIKKKKNQSSAHLEVNLQIRNAKSEIKTTGSYSSTTRNSRSLSKLQWHLRNLCQEKEMFPTVDSEAIIRKNASLPEVKHAASLPSCCQDGPGTMVKYKSKLMKPRKVPTERAKQEQRWNKNQGSWGRAGRTQMHSYSLEACGAVQSHWRNSLTYLFGGSKHQSDPNLLGRLIADSYR